MTHLAAIQQRDADQGTLSANAYLEGVNLRKPSPRPTHDFASETFMREAMAALVAAPSTAFKWTLGRSEVALAAGESQVVLASLVGAISQDEAAAALKMSVGTFRARMFRMGVSYRHFHKQGWTMKKVVGNELSTFVTAKLYARHLLGTTAKDLEQEFSLSASSVKYILDNANGVKPLKSSISPRPTHDFASETFMREAMAALVAAPSTAFKWTLGRSEVALAAGESQVVLAALVGGLSQEEAAAALKMQVATFRARLFRMGVSHMRFHKQGWTMKKVVGNKLSTFVTAKLYARHLLGATAKDLEQEFSLSASSVKYILDNANGVKPLESSGSHKAKLKRAVEYARACSVEEWEVVLKAVATAGGDTRLAARALGIDEYRVIEVVQSDAVDAATRDQHSLTPRMITKIVRLRKEGKTPSEVAEILNVEVKTVYRNSRKYGFAQQRDPVGKVQATMSRAAALPLLTQIGILKGIRDYGIKRYVTKNSRFQPLTAALLVKHGVERVRNRDAAGSYKKGATFYSGLTEAIAKLENELVK